jgi:serine/threonine protein kinase
MIGGASTEILFEKFQIIEVLKKDEHAAVFLANHIYLNKKIILKVLNTKKISDQALVERFKREAKILAKLDNPYIIKVLDFGTFKEYFYISFEYIEGMSLRNLLKQQTLTFDQKKHLMTQLLKGLYNAHQNQVIHRDIKPENIFIDYSLNLKIGDFGLALSSEDSFVTNPYSIVGTPSYMSPEQVSGAKLNAQSDLFSAGVVLYELFTGKNPFLKENVSFTLNEIMSFNESTIAQGLENQPQEIKDVLYNLLRKNAKDRYASASEVLSDLKISLDQPTIVINYDEKRVQKNRYRLIAAGITVGVIFLVIMLVKFFDKPAPTGNPNFTFQGDNSTTSPQEKDTSQKKPVSDEQIDSNNLNKPLIDNSQRLNQNSTNSSQNDQTLPNDNKVLGYGTLNILCVQWAKVSINGEDVGTTPFRPIQLKEGTHTIQLENPAYPIITETLTISPNKATTYRADFDKRVAYLNFDVRPSGSVTINGSLRGTIPPPLRFVKVNPGFVSIIITNEDLSYKNIDTSFNVSGGDTLNLKFKFKRK